MRSKGNNGDQVSRNPSRFSLPCAGAAAHDLVRLLDDELAARLALFIALALGLVIAHVHELRVVVAVCSSGSGPRGLKRKVGKKERARKEGGN